MNKLIRKEVKVHEETQGILIVYDTQTQELAHVNEDYTSKSFKKYRVEDIIYDDHVTSCYYSTKDHPMRKIFSDAFIEASKMYAQNRMTVILDSLHNNLATIVVYPTDKVKLFKENK